VPAGVVIVLDVKCPGSGESHRNCWENLANVRPHDEVKFVVKDRADYEFARDVISERSLSGRVAAIHLSPVHGVLDAKTLAEWVIADRLLFAFSFNCINTFGAPTRAACERTPGVIFSSK